MAAVVAALLAACASRPPERDGPGDNPPPNLERVPDAEPRIESIRAGGPNKPYEVLGQRYVPHTGDVELVERGLASWYGRKFHGRPTSLGETYDMYGMTAAHKTMPLPSYARVRNPANGREVVVRINDRGPFAPGRVIDLSYTAALRLGLLNGVAPVEVRRITHDEIRAGLGKAPPLAAVTASLPARPAARPADAPAAPAVAGLTVPSDARDAADPSPRLLPVAAAPTPPAGTTAAPSLPPDDPAPGDPIAALADATAQRGGFWLQLGAFRQREGATALRDRALRLPADAPPLALLREEGDVLRVHAGPYATRAEAQQAAVRLRTALGVAPLVLEPR